MPIHELPPVRMPSGGAAGKALLDNVPQGDVIDGFVLKLTGTTNSTSNITGIRVRVGGKDVISVSGAEIDLINHYRGVPQDSGFVPIWFADHEAFARQQWSEGALDTLNRTYSNIQIVVEYDGNQSSDANIEARLLVGQDKVGPKDQIEQLRDRFRALLATQQDLQSGTQEYKMHLGSEGGPQIQAAYWFGSNINEIEVKRDGVNLYDRLPVADLRYVQKHNRSPQSGMEVFDPTFNDFHSRGVPTLRPNGTPAPMRFLLTMSATETVRGVADVMATIDQI